MDITMDSIVKEGKESKHPFREIILFLRRYQHISNNSKIPSVESICNFINILENEEQNLKFHCIRMFFSTCLRVLLVKVMCSPESEGYLRKKGKELLCNRKRGLPTTAKCEEITSMAIFCQTNVFPLFNLFYGVVNLLLEELKNSSYLRRHS